MNLQTVEDKQKIGNVMSSPVVTADLDMNLVGAVQIMVSKGNGNLALINGEKVVGILTERELLRHLALNKSIPNKKLRYILSQKFVKPTPNTSIVEAAKTIISEKARLLVFHDTRKISASHLIGIITASDIWRAFLKIGKDYNPSIERSMTNKVFEVRSDSPILSAVKLMLRKRIGSVIVTSGRSSYAILIERDLHNRILSEHVDIEETICRYCSYPVVSATLGVGAGGAGKIMAKNKIKRLPLVEKDCKIVAMVTARDLVEAYREGL